MGEKLIQALMTWLQDNQIAAIISIASGLAGIVGGVYSYYQWKSERKRSRVYDQLFQLAERNIDRDVNEKTLKQQEEQIRDASQKINDLQLRIQRDIPKEARRAVLRDRFEEQTRAALQLHESIVSLKTELGALGTNIDIPAELKSFIENEVSPEYIVRNRVEHYKTYLTISTTAAALVSALTPFPLNTILAPIILAISGVVLLLLIRATLRGRSGHILPMALAAAPWVVFVLSGIFGIVAIFAALVAIQDQYMRLPAEISAAIAAVVFFASLVLAIRLLNKRKGIMAAA
jgi:hypothetical protein